MRCPGSTLDPQAVIVHLPTVPQTRAKLGTTAKNVAAGLSADAVVGVDLDYNEISGGGKGMVFLVASGTAVRLR